MIKSLHHPNPLILCQKFQIQYWIHSTKYFKISSTFGPSVVVGAWSGGAWSGDGFSMIEGAGGEEEPSMVKGTGTIWTAWSFLICFEHRKRNRNGSSRQELGFSLQDIWVVYENAFPHKIPRSSQTFWSYASQVVEGVLVVNFANRFLNLQVTVNSSFLLQNLNLNSVGNLPHSSDLTMITSQFQLSFFSSHLTLVLTEQNLLLYVSSVYFDIHSTRLIEHQY